MTLAEQLEITSDTMHAESLQHEIHFVGNAKVKQLKDWITADEIIVYLNENNETERYEAVGKSKFEFENEKGHYLGHANRVKYFPKTSLYKLEGKAMSKDMIHNRTVTGDKITVNMKDGSSKVIGSRNKPVKVILQMGK
jgi:lipopolysaccharide export system protein LptA